MSGWLTPGTLLGLLIAAAFVVVAFRDLPRAVLVYAVLGAVPWLQVGAFSGNEFVQGLLLAQVLATVLVAVWLLQRPGAVPAAVARVPFNKWLLLVIPATLLSLISGVAWLDPTVPQQNVKLMVSVGQVLLVAWPIGVYLVTSDQVRQVAWITSFRRLVTILALPQLVLLVWDGGQPYLSFSWYFGLIASPLACARLFESSTGGIQRLGLIGLTLLPLVEGLRTGKAFLYLYVVFVLLTVLWVRARRVAVAAALAGAALLLVVQLVPMTSLLPAPVEALLDIERRQQSWDGRAGRVALAQDAIAIWSKFPVLGVGPANSYPYMLRYSVIGTPHSQYFNFLVEFGLLGLGLFVLFVLGVIRFGLQAVAVRRTQEERVFLVGWLASFVAWSACSLIGDYMLHSIRNGGIEMFSGYYIHWVFLGAAVGIARHRQPALRPAVAARSAPTTWATMQAAQAVPRRLRA